MNGWDLLLSPWEFYPSVVAGCILLLAAYGVSTRFRRNWRAFSFFLGVLILFLALVSPLDTLADDYLFSAHMFQHILLDMVCPIFLVLGLPDSLVRRWYRWPVLDRGERILSYPPLALSAGVLTLWIWHLPVLYDAALGNDSIHAFQHMTFLVTGVILWWPVLNPVPERRMAPLASVVYLSAAMAFYGLLAIILTIADTSFYEPYNWTNNLTAAGKIIRNTWGLNPVSDQKLGGAIMWVFGNLIFLVAIMSLVIRWYGEHDTEPVQIRGRRHNG